VHGSKGVAYADLLHGNAITAYSAEGYDYSVEKGGSTKGWSFPIYEEAYNYGFHAEMAHFVDCVRFDRKSEVTGKTRDGARGDLRRLRIRPDGQEGQPAVQDRGEETVGFVGEEVIRPNRPVRREI